MHCKRAKRDLLSATSDGPLLDSLEKHLESCRECADEHHENGRAWARLEAFEAPPLGEPANTRIRHQLTRAASDADEAQSRRGGSGQPRLALPQWASIAAAVLLGIVTGSWLGLGFGRIVEGEQPLSQSQATLLETADVVFDIAPPESPAAAWFSSPDREEG